MGAMRDTGDQQELPAEDNTQAQDTGSEFQGMMQQQAANRQQQINQRIERQGYMDRAYNQPTRRRYQRPENPFLGLLAQLGQQQQQQQPVFSNTEGAWFGLPQQQSVDPFAQHTAYDAAGAEAQRRAQLRMENFYGAGK